LEVPFKLNEHALLAQHNEVVSFSFPVAKGEVFTLSILQLVNERQTVEVAEFSEISRWPDASLKWVRCNFIALSTSPVDQKYRIKSNATDQNIKIEPELTYHNNQSSTDVSNGHYTFQLDHAQLLINNIPWQLELIDTNQNKLNAKLNNFVLVDTTSKLKNQALYQGTFQLNDQEVCLEFECKITFNVIAPTIKVEFTLRNPKAMVHNQGKWDLGNDNSFNFNSFNIAFKNTDPERTNLTCFDQSNQHNSKGEFTLFQASSGGENWNSSNHMDKDGVINTPFKGFQIKRNQDIIFSGSRAEPLVSTYQGENKLTIICANFWQNFPKAISSKQGSLNLGLFPFYENTVHELQPGEQKTHVFFLHLGNDPIEALRHLPLDNTVTICPEYLAETKVIPYFSQSIDEDLTKIINEGLSSDNNFFNKREITDEYGWRNFGDIYADHETLEYQGNKELISHYNNQYDALYGFIRQFLVTGNSQWWTLASDLAQHVKDIDIYHTDEDKAEYNNGLFWHTDHYLPAETASHRTYSQRQQANAYQDHAGGGGPGGQHCYTTGLMLHYYLTADETSKTTVIKLADWITNFYEGSGTTFEFLLGVKNRKTPGLKNKLTGQYPLDRGTGNYIVALLDAYELTNKQSYLDRVSLIIKHTASPDENLVLRNLSDIEESWFYTIFLQAVLRYLMAKKQANQFDSSFNYAKDLLQHFSNWMIDNEAPYLNTPENLEYPNHTWAAQDIRKANVLYGAYYFSEKNDINTNQYKNKADEFYQYVYNSLKTEETRTYTRILAILMQNSGFKSFVEHNTSKAVTTIPATGISKQPSSAKFEFVKALAKTLRDTSLKKELTWLCLRSSKAEQLIGKFIR